MERGMMVRSDNAAVSGLCGGGRRKSPRCYPAHNGQAGGPGERGGGGGLALAVELAVQRDPLGRVLTSRGNGHGHGHGRDEK